MGTDLYNPPVLFLILSLISCGPPAGPQSANDRSQDIPSTPFTPEGKAVVVFQGSLRRGPGSGQHLGEVEPDTVVTIGSENDGWRQIEIESPLRLKAWIHQERLGCRALEDMELTPLDETKPQVKLRPGALLAIKSAHQDQLEVETQGSISIRGRVERAKCGVGRPFIPTLPRDGTPSRLVRAAVLSADVDHGGGRSIRLEEGQRFTVFITKGGNAYGRTDGPVILRGHIDASALDRDGRTPFDRLAEPLGYTHEVLLDSQLHVAPNGNTFADLPGGTPLNVTGRQDEWANVMTFGKVRLDGWIRWSEVRRVSLDHNELDPAARRREHFPIVRDDPRGMELLEEPAP